MSENGPRKGPRNAYRPSRFATSIDHAAAELRSASRGIGTSGVVAVVAIVVVALLAAPAAPLFMAALVAAAIAGAGTVFVLQRRLIAWAQVLAERAHSDAALPRELLQSADRFARSSAGVDGTIAEFVAVAADHRCEVLLWDDETRTLSIPARDEAHQLPPPAAHRLISAMGRRRPLRIPHLAAVPGLPRELVEQHGTVALLLAPIWAADSFLGCVMRRYRTSDELYSANEADRIGAVASLGAVALGKAITVDSERRSSRENAMLLRAVERSLADNLPELLDGYAAEAREAADAVGVALVRLTGRSGWVAAGSGIQVDAADALRTGATGPSLTRWLRAMGGRSRTAEAGLLDQHLPGLGTAFPIGTDRYLVQPVSDNRSIVAALVIGNPAPAPDGRQADLLAVIARQIGLALERSDINRVMEQRSQRLARAPRLARAIAGQRDPRAVARLAVRELVDGFGYCRSSIALREAGDLRIVASAGVLAAQPSPTGACTEPLRAAFEDARARVLCGVGIDDPRHDPNAPRGCRSQLVVPVTGSDGRSVGVIAVYGRLSDSLGEDDLHLLESIADHLAATLQQAALYGELEDNYFKTVEALAAALEAKDAYTLDHSRSITEVAASVGRRLGMDEESLRELRLGALLHDIGKIGIPTEILNKPGALDEEERLVMESHTVIGEQIIAPVEFLRNVRPLVLHEHERWDGKGYPHGLAGHDIPLGARIIFVCDAWHAMTTDRPYRKAMAVAAARQQLSDGAGSQFDPDVVTAFLEIEAQGFAGLDVAAVSGPAAASGLRA